MRSLSIVHPISRTLAQPFKKELPLKNDSTFSAIVRILEGGLRLLRDSTGKINILLLYLQEVIVASFKTLSLILYLFRFLVIHYFKLCARTAAG